MMILLHQVKTAYRFLWIRHLPICFTPRMLNIYMKILNTGELNKNGAFAVLNPIAKGPQVVQVSDPRPLS